MPCRTNRVVMNSFIAAFDACIILQTMKMSLIFYSFSSFSFVWVHRLPSNGQGKTKELLAPSTMEPAHPLCRDSMVATRKRDAQRPAVGQCPFSAGVVFRRDVVGAFPLGHGREAVGSTT